MPRIYVEFSGLDQIGSRCKTVASRVDTIQSNFQRTVRQLDWDIRFESNINSTATQIAKTLEQYSRTLETYQRFIEDTHNEYVKLDEYKKTNLIDYISSIRVDPNVAVILGPGNNPFANWKDRISEIVFDTDEEEIMMNLDISKIERVILNLLSNAIKFSKENGDIYVTINSQNEELEIIVEDNGIGISEENKRTIFEKFTQVDTSLNRKNEGSGTGLSLANALVKLHNGEITVQSEINKGTKFIVKLHKEINIDKNSDLIDYKKENYYDINVIDKVINTEHKTRAELSDIYM